MDFNEVLAAARGNMGHCKVCAVCDGRVCGNTIPGPGAKGSGTVARKNYAAWQQVELQMDTLVENKPVDTTAHLFGQDFALPVFAGPVGSVKMHYGEKYDDIAYNEILVKGCVDAGIAAFTGDGTAPQTMIAATENMAKVGGVGVPTVKPWALSVIQEKMALVRESGCFAVAMDVDAAGLPFLKNSNPPAGRKSVDELREIIGLAPAPFIVKGVMTVAGARKAIDAGAKGIVVSNHGGRVLDACSATADVLPQIVDAVQGEATVLVDGGIRTGIDVFRALALGADGVIIARPFVNAVYGAAEEGIQVYVDKLRDELADAMFMCGANTLADITRSMVRIAR